MDKANGNGVAEAPTIGPARRRRGGVLDQRQGRVRPDQRHGRLAAVARNIAAGKTVEAACRSAGIAVSSYYRWRARPADATQESDGLRLRAAILDAAKFEFLRSGFGASIGRVAATAGVARQTVYNKFGRKERLFAEVVQQLYETVVAPVFVPEPQDDLHGMLTECAAATLQLMLDPEAVELLRITLGEYRRHPELAKLAYAIRTARTAPNIASAIARRLADEMAAGTLDRVDPFLAAENFIGSFSAHARHRALVGSRSPTGPELDQRIDLAVEIFLKGLGYRGAA